MDSKITQEVHELCSNARVSLNTLVPVVQPAVLQPLRGAVDRLSELVLALQSEANNAATLLRTILHHNDEQRERQRDELEQLASEAADWILREERRAEAWERRARTVRKRVEQSLCVVCLERHRNVVLRPCFHLALCETCCRAMADDQRCPICRTVCEQVDVIMMP